MKIPKSDLTKQTIQYSGIFGLDFKYSDIGWYDFRIYIEKWTVTLNRLRTLIV